MPLTFDFIPLGVFFFLVIAIVLSSFELGFYFGKRQWHRKDHPKDSTVGSISGATLGLLAFILAFTFGYAASRYETRRNLVLDEANALETTYLRAGYLDEPQSREIRNLLKSFLDIRLAADKQMSVEDILKKSDQLLEQLWNHTEELAKKHPDSETMALFVESTNNIIELHSKRVMSALWGRVPLVVWITLFLLTICSMFSMGYLSGLTGIRNIAVNLTLTLSFSIVIFLIADLDRPREGLIRTIQQPYINLQKKIAGHP